MLFVLIVANAWCGALSVIRSIQSKRVERIPAKKKNVLLLLLSVVKYMVGEREKI